MGKLDAFKDFVRPGVPISTLTWLGLGGPIEYLAEPRSEKELVDVLKVCAEEGIEARVLGEGSNILASDLGAPGVAIRLSEPCFCEIQIESPNVVVGAGVKIGRLATAVASAGLGGLEGLIGVPGTVGAGVVANVSTSDATLGQWVESARVATFSGEILELTQDDFVFGYRSSNLDNVVVLSVKFRLEPDSPEELTRRLQKFWIVREKTRPEVGGGLARMFQNPRGQKASELIYEAGFSGARIGGAFVCEKNSNLIQTEPGATSEDVKRLLTLIQTQASERIGVQLERELVIW